MSWQNDISEKQETVSQIDHGQKGPMLQRWFPQTRLVLGNLSHSLLFFRAVSGQWIWAQFPKDCQKQPPPHTPSDGSTVDLLPSPKQEKVGGSRLTLIMVSHDSVCAEFPSLCCQFYVFIVILGLKLLSQTHIHVSCWGFWIALCLSKEAHSEWSGLFHYFMSPVSQPTSRFIKYS